MGAGKRRKLPKPKIMYPEGYPVGPREEICELEQAKYRFNYSETVVMLEESIVHSYEQLVQLTSQDEYEDREFLQVELLPPAIEGG